MDEEPLIPQHGGYRKLRSFRIAQLIYDVTARFCDRYVERKSRTRDQMVQVARSGVQNIAEGSKASGTSKKTELKLTNVARANLEELRLDYEDFLRQRGLELWPPEHPALKRFRERKCSTLREVRLWVKAEVERNTDPPSPSLRRTGEHGQARNTTDKRIKKSAEQQARTAADKRTGTPGDRRTPTPRVKPASRPSPPPEQFVANAALSLLNVACHLLDRQLASQARAFENEGGFTERLYRTRRRKRDGG